MRVVERNKKNTGRSVQWIKTGKNGKGEKQHDSIF